MPNFSTTHPMLTKKCDSPYIHAKYPYFLAKKMKSPFCSKWGWQVWINGSAPAIIPTKIYDFLKLVSRKNKCIGWKRPKEMKIAETMPIKGLQNFKNQANILNLVDIEIESVKLRNLIAHYQEENFSFRFIVESLLFSQI